MWRTVTLTISDIDSSLISHDFGFKPLLVLEFSISANQKSVLLKQIKKELNEQSIRQVSLALSQPKVSCSGLYLVE